MSNELTREFEQAARPLIKVMWERENHKWQLARPLPYGEIGRTGGFGRTRRNLVRLMEEVTNGTYSDEARADMSAVAFHFYTDLAFETLEEYVEEGDPDGYTQWDALHDLIFFAGQQSIAPEEPEIYGGP